MSTYVKRLGQGFCDSYTNLSTVYIGLPFVQIWKGSSRRWEWRCFNTFLLQVSVLPSYLLLRLCSLIKKHGRTCMLACLRHVNYSLHLKNHF